MTGWVLLFLGGGTGAVLRGALSEFIQLRAPNAFPWGVLAVNLLGCLAIGVLMPVSQLRSPADQNLKLLLVTGLLGGFTTFSAFGLDTWRLFAGGELGLAVLNVLASLLGGLVAVAIGAWIAQNL